MGPTALIVAEPAALVLAGHADLIQRLADALPNLISG